PWQRALRKAVNWLCATAPYRGSTDFPQFPSTVREPQRAGAWTRTWRNLGAAWDTTLERATESLGGAWQSLAEQLALRLRGPTARFSGGLLTLLLLLPLPAFALSFGNNTWSVQDNTGKGFFSIGPGTDPSHLDIQMAATNSGNVRGTV